MIISRLTGGLGNQLFQYAFGRLVSIRRNTELWLDISFHRKQRARLQATPDWDLPLYRREFLSTAYQIAASRVVDLADLPSLTSELKTLNETDLDPSANPLESVGTIGDDLRSSFVPAEWIRL
jgi:hypothetical protein